MIIYRIENHNRVGPFHNHFGLPSADKQRRWAAHIGNFGTLENEVPGFRYVDNRGYVAGCSSMDQLMSWFGEFMKELIAAGYRIAKYEVDDSSIVYGKTQVAFLRDEATFWGYMQTDYVEEPCNG